MFVLPEISCSRLKRSY